MPLELLRSDLKDYQSASNLQFNEQIKELIAKGENIYHFGFGESPFPVPECFREGLVRSAHRNEYLSVQGLLPLREKIIKFHKQFRDYDHFSPNQMVLGTGSKELIYHIMNVFGGEVLLPSPSWTSYLPQTVLSGRKSIVVDGHLSNRYIPTAEAIEKAVSEGDPALPKMIVLNSPNNPTGAVYSEHQLRDIAQVCRKYNVVVLSDEIYARTATVPFNSIAKYYSEGTIVTTGFSKWASLGGWRAGYALFPPELGRLQEAVASAGSHSFTCQAAPVQHALSYGLDHSFELEDYIKRTRTVLSMAGSYCHRELHKVGVIGNEPEGAYYFMPDFEVCRSKDVSSGTELCTRLLAEANVALMPCDPHYIRPAGELTTRFAFVNSNGSEAMKEVPLEHMFDEAYEEEFLRQYCPRLVEGVNAITHWVMRNEKEQAN